MLAAPAAAQERMCHGQLDPGPPPTPEQRELATLRDFARQRASFGFRHDLPYVRELIRRGVWEYDVGYIPVTPRENVYLRLRDDLELGARAERYLDRFADLDAGGSIEDDWPREPYLQLYLTRDLARHRAALRRLARHPDNLRLKRVRHSWADLRRVQDRIGRDEARLRRAGFHIIGTGLQPSVNRVVADVITRRRDGGRYFRRHYGPVRVDVAAKETRTTVCRDVGWFEVTREGVRVHWESDTGAKVLRVELTEYPDRVEIGIVERVDTITSTLNEASATAPVRLAAPLGDRAVIDAADRRRLVQRGPAPGEPPCTPQSPTPRADRQPGPPAPEAALRDLEERIDADVEAGSGFLDGYGRAGFYVVGSEVGDDRTVTVRLITTRPDHAAWFAARYGPAVRTEVIGDRYECAHMTG